MYLEVLATRGFPRWLNAFLRHSVGCELEWIDRVCDEASKDHGSDSTEVATMLSAKDLMISAMDSLESENKSEKDLIFEISTIFMDISSCLDKACDMMQSSVS